MEFFTLSPSWLLTTTLGLFMLCMFLYALRSIRSSKAATYKLPPNPPTYPIIGNLHNLLGKSRHQALWQLSKQYGPIMQLYIGSKPFVIISTPSLAKQVLKTHDNIFCSRPSSKAARRLTYDYLDLAFSPQSDHRKEKRKILVSEFLGPKRARSFNHVLVMEIESMVNVLSLKSSKEEVNLSKMLLAMVKEVVCKVGFGKNYKEEPIKGTSWEEILDEAVVMLDGSFSDSFPWFGEIFDILSGWNRKLEKCFRNLDAYIQMIVDDHNSHRIEDMSEDEKDFVHRLIELSSMENASNCQLTKDDMKALIMNVFTGGIDTTVSAMEWAMSEIARSPRVMQKLQTEIRNCTGKIQKVNELDITKMTYLKMVVKEALRLHSPAPLLIPHECSSHCQIGGYDVFPGTTVVINAWGIGKDPSTWGENAGEFYPERFEELDVDSGGGSFEMVPFGWGRRSCPAMNTAPITVELVIANLLYWFDWELPDGLKNEDLNMEEDGSLIIHKKVSLCLVPIKHIWEDK
ncbi:parthenolide synthase-like [Bidens hawaiensis]|uniref:parthenolide synthase-like n=1 Tax=Bidens hawaiensis TaxID=980011 RepID=UPI00404A9013